MKTNLYKIFLLFEIIITLFIINALLIAGSLLSLFILFPVLLTATFSITRRLVHYNEFNGVLYSFFTFIKGNVFRTLKVLYPLTIFILLLLFNIFYFNEILIGAYPDYINGIILVAQFLLLYQLLGVLFISSLMLTAVDENRKIKDYYFYAFILFNANPIRSFLAILSTLVSIGLIFQTTQIAFFLFLPLGIILFYIVYVDVFEQKNF
ncbi:MAG: hypothetical protein K9L26_00825 [Candidatus Izimaplasma sp.]|nr:hypothetical protein [Candidatus Izimaplasma bacterium]